MTSHSRRQHSRVYFIMIDKLKNRTKRNHFRRIDNYLHESIFINTEKKKKNLFCVILLHDMTTSKYQRDNNYTLMKNQIQLLNVQKKQRQEIVRISHVDVFGF